MKNILHKITFFIALLATISPLSYSQTGAGGVGSSSNNAIWLDAHAMGLANGSQVATFTDVSGNTNNFTQTTAIKRPIYTTSAINGISALHFDGSNDHMLSGVITALQSANLTYFMVFQRAPLASEMLITSKYTSSANKWRLYSNTGSNTLISAQYSPSIQWVGYTDPGAPTFISTQITPTVTSLHKQGVLQQTKNVAYTTPTGHENVVIGGTIAGSYSLNGYIAEVIVYNTSLNNLQRIMIENYLGTKYGMTIPTDMFAFESTHRLGLVGIGSNGVNTQTTARGADVMEISNPSSLNSGDYLLAARTDVALTNYTSSDLPGSLPGFDRWTRTWRVDETNSIGTTDIKFYLSGGLNFANSATYRLLVDDDGNFSNATVIAGTYNGTNQTVTFNTDLNDGQYFTLCGDTQVLQIHSVTSNVWSNPLTWDCNCVPNFDDAVYINPGHNVTVNINAETDFLRVEPTATLTMSSNVTLSIYGQTEWMGSASLTNGKLAFVGITNQSITTGSSGIQVNNFEVNKASGSLTVSNASIVLNGTFYPTLGNITISSTLPNEFVVNSTSAVTSGRIGPVGNAFTFTGKFTVRRFLPAGPAEYRDICSPVSGATFSMWDADINISGTGFPDGCAYGSGGGGCFYSLMYYNNNAAINVTNLNTTIPVGMGYEAFVGDNLSTFSGATLEVTGTLNDGQDLVISASTNYSTHGNPYASPVLFPSTTRAGVGNYFYIYDSSTGAYEYYDGSDGSSSIPQLASGIISIGQAFWIEGPGTITFTDGCKTTANATFVKSSEAAPLMIYLRENSSTYSSNISLVESVDGDDETDALLDVTHFSTGLEKAPGIALYSNEDLLRKNYIKKDHRNKSFNVYTNIRNAGYYSIEAANIENFDTYNKVLLYDNETGNFVNLKNEVSYTFYSDIFEGNRFTVILTNEELAAESTITSLTVNDTTVDSEMTITQMGHSFNVILPQDLNENSQVKLVNILGQMEVYSAQIHFMEGSNIITVPSDLKGIHILVITTGDKMVTKKVVL